MRTHNVNRLIIWLKFWLYSPYNMANRGQRSRLQITLGIDKRKRLIGRRGGGTGGGQPRSYSVLSI